MSRSSSTTPRPRTTARRARGRHVATLSLIGLALLAVRPALAGDDDPSPLTIHGFLIQGYGLADDHQIFGIPTDGTTDLRSVAVQFRYDFNRRDVVVVQLNHERTGVSALRNAREDVALDWAFYERRFNDHTSIKVGRIPLPFGSYNEIRDLGTLLPFYRAPRSIYGEAGQTNVISQNFDGLLVSHDFPLSSWSLTTEVYGGEWNAFVPRGTEVSKERFTDVAGIQIWLNTPTPGFRFGVAATQFSGPGVFSPPGLIIDYDSILLSAEVPIRRFTFQAEYLDIDADFSYSGYYALLGYKITDAVRLFVQAEKSDFELTVPPFGLLNVDFNDEWALGVDWWVSPEVVVKVEGHATEGFAVEDVPVINPLGPRFKTNYGIVSLAVSF